MENIKIERIKDDKIFAYDVKYNERALLELYKEIIKKCGIRKHVLKRTSKLPDELHTENYNELEPVPPLILPNGIPCSRMGEALIEYDEIETPLVAQIIDKMVDQDCKTSIEDIELLTNPDVEKLIREYDIEKAMDELDLTETDKEKNRKLELDNQFKYLYKLKLLVCIRKVYEEDYKTFLLK